jgi:type II secretory pathway pseudopilin PulG
VFINSVKDPCRAARDRGAHRSRRGGSAGFTLIEAMLIITLLAVGMTGVFYLMAVGTDMNINTREQMLAYQAANAQMDYLRQKPYTMLTNVTSSAFGTTTGSASYQALSQLANSQGVYTIVDYNTGSDIVKQITVTVNWSRKSSSRNRAVTVSTLASKGGLNERWNN